ncbi:33457_t:CDS:2 [Gigaspora margarita]|uniref:33457_t:CDS:1 n=1 Tax=Gigaspora margarita TaxID=4874 RepID=A0ABM8W6X7_GIGMA|nr:33457_t:CDS:2 [Gigaspora margarita]
MNIFALENQNNFENNAHPKDDTVNDLNEPNKPVSNHKLVNLNEDMLLSIILNNSFKKIIQIPIETIGE